MYLTEVCLLNTAITTTIQNRVRQSEERAYYKVSKTGNWDLRI